MKTVRALVLTGYGLNCDHETAHALNTAGAEARRVHINTLIEKAVRLADYQVLVFGGGFSWGDDHGAGVVQAVRFKTRLGPELDEFIAGGNLVLGICNGFQTLVNMGLLPGLDGDTGARSVALTYNDCGNFRDDWVALRVNPDSHCVYTRGIERLELPIRHGEGKFYTRASVIDRMNAGGQVVLHYARPDGRPAGGHFPYNPNGSLADIAGICDPTGRVFGLMPHPEGYLHPTNHPDWTRWQHKQRSHPDSLPPAVLGTRIFENAVEYLKAA